MLTEWISGTVFAAGKTKLLGIFFLRHSLSVPKTENKCWKNCACLGSPHDKKNTFSYISKGKRKILISLLVLTEITPCPNEIKDRSWKKSILRGALVLNIRWMSSPFILTVCVKCPVLHFCNRFGLKHSWS